LGVEIGQVLFVFSLIASVRLIQLGFRNDRNDWLARAQAPAAYIVGSITMYWTIERVAGFLV